MRRQARRRASGCPGIAVIELLVALAVLAVLMTVIVHAWSWSRAHSAVRSAVAALSSDLAYARQLGLMRARQAVSLCPSTDGQRCTPSAAWHEGWIVFVDGNRNGQRETDAGVDGGEMLLRVHGRFTGVSVAATRGVDRAVTFRSNAQSYQPNGAFLAGSWVVCPNGPGQGRKIIMSAMGRVRVEDAQPNACQP